MSEPSTVGFHRILVPTDFGEASQHAIATALALAGQLDAEIILLHVISLHPAAYDPGLALSVEDLRKELDKTLRLELEKLQKAHAKTSSMLADGEPWSEILAAVERSHADLIVMGTHGRSGLPRLFLGSVAERILRASPVPVLTVTSADSVLP